MDIISSSFRDAILHFKAASQVMAYVWFIVLPPALFYLFKVLWIYHIQLKYWSSLDWMLLEVIAGKEIEKSPKSMEALYVGMAGVEKTFNPLEKFVQGAFPDAFSLELVSDGGQMHFYIRTMKKYRHLVEAHLFAQYPDIEITEAPDYVNDIPKVVPNAQWDLWGTDLEFTKHHAFPIKTYKQFEEDVTGKMIDPLASLAETMSKLAPGQKIWFQIIISPHPPSWAKDVGLALADKLKGREVKVENILSRIWSDLMDVIGSIFAGMMGPIDFSAESAKKDDQPLDTRLSPGERDVLKAVEENLGKIMFKSKVRFLYLGRRDGFDKSFVSSFMGGLKQFGDDNMNGMKPEDSSKTYANYVFTKERLRYRQRKILRRYRNRSFDGAGIMTFSTEELATLYHLPDMLVAAPSLTRIDAKRGGAPSNLPIE